MAASMCKITSLLPQIQRASPIKKKKKLDPAIEKKREERKKRRLETEINKLQKTAKQFKPLDEVVVSPQILKEKGSRSRKLKPIEFDESERRALLLKEWSKYGKAKSERDDEMIHKMLESRELALRELRAESEELYQEAIQLDPELIPFRCSGPNDTPPIPGFASFDGEYIDTTRKWR